MEHPTFSYTVYIGVKLMLKKKKKKKKQGGQ